MLLDAHARLSAAVRGQQEYVLASRSGREHHAFRHAEPHFSRCQVGDDHDVLADELGGVVSSLDPGEHLPARVAEIQRESEQFVRTIHGLGFIDSCNSKIDLHEIVDRYRVVLRCLCSVVGVPGLVDHALHLLGFDSRQQWFEFVDAGIQQW